MKWEVTFYSEQLEQELLSLPKGVLARLLRFLDRMQTYGPDLGMPRARAMGDGLFELRIKSQEGAERVFHCTLSGKRILLLHHFAKKTQKTPVHELRKARQRLKEAKHADV